MEEESKKEVKMQLKSISKNKEKTKYCFLLKSVDSSLLNAIRRSVISLVPVMAIENVEVRKNSSILYDEVLAHRLGLIPMKTDLKHYEMIKNEGDEESLKCTAKFTLKVKGPKTVYSKDLKPADPAIAPVYENIPLVKLLKNQEIVLEATSVLGIGKEHMKWSPGIVYYKNKPIVNINAKGDVEELKKIIPEDSALKITGNKIAVDEEKLYTTSFLDAYIGESLGGCVDVSMAEDEFVLFIETFGQLSAKEMMMTSTDVLKDKLDELNILISKA